MASRAHFLLGGCLFLSVGAMSPAQADPITVTFTAFPAAEDLVNTGPSTGFFTFDSSLIPAGGGLIQNNLTGLGATDISFVWSNTHWTTANADVRELEFSPSGELLTWTLDGWPPGGQFNGFGPTVPASLIVNDFAATVQRLGGPQGGYLAWIAYTNAGVPMIYAGVLDTEIPSAPIPEPTSIVLLATGAALLGYARRREKPRASASRTR